MTTLTTAEALLIETLRAHRLLGVATSRLSRDLELRPELDSLQQQGLVAWDVDADGDDDFSVTLTEAGMSTEGASTSVGARPTRRLIVAPHCDDETLGCGGLIAKNPHECAVVVVTRPSEVRRKEFDRAREALGYETCWFLDFEDGRSAQNMRELVGALDGISAEFQPDELYLPIPGMHQDHIASYEAGVRSARLSMTEGHHYTASVYAYDVAVYELGLYPSDLKWNFFESLTEPQIDAKVEALRAYSSQSVIGPHPVNSIKEQAAVHGHARQVDWAEQFALIRGVRV